MAELDDVRRKQLENDNVQLHTDELGNQEQFGRDIVNQQDFTSFVDKTTSLDDYPVNIINDPIFIETSQKSTGKGEGKSKNIIVNSTINPLNDFANYTYNIELFALDQTLFNTKIRNAEVDTADIADNLLISSGGKRYKGQRNQYFSDDFYIEDFEMKTIGPTTSISRHTNNINIKFKIIEPYGVSLLERLMSVAKSFGLPYKMYTELPYLLKISFLGYDESGKPTRVDNATRYIPIKIWQIKFEITEMGATYSIDAEPYNHYVFRNIHETIPLDVEISYNKIEDAISRNVKSTREGAREVPDIGPAYNRLVSYENYSIVGMLNKYQQDLAAQSKPNQTVNNPIADKTTKYKNYPDEYDVVFLDDEIKNAEIVYNSFSPEMMGQEKDDKRLKFYQNYVNNVNKRFEIDKKKSLVKINAGSSLLEIISILLIHSTYVQDQFIPRTNDSERASYDKPLKWFKITPDVELLKWDDTLNRFAFKITYYVSSFRKSNVRYETKRYSIPKGNVAGEGFHKQYEFIFGRENVDLMKFDIKYNLAYLFANTVVNTDNDDENTSISPSKLDDDSPFIDRNEPTPALKSQTSNISSMNQSGKGFLARNIMNKVLTEGPELVAIEAEILGDPDWITQSDIYFRKHLIDESFENGAFLVDGSINTDYTDMLAKFNFRTPVDYNDATGQMDFASSRQFNQTTAFGGVYAIWQVETSLTGGAFTQKLKGNRIFELQEFEDSARDVERITRLDEQAASRFQDNLAVFNGQKFVEGGTEFSDSLRFGTSPEVNVKDIRDYFNDADDQLLDDLIEIEDDRIRQEEIRNAPPPPPAPAGTATPPLPDLDISRFEEEKFSSDRLTPADKQRLNKNRPE